MLEIPTYIWCLLAFIAGIVFTVFWMNHKCNALIRKIQDNQVNNPDYFLAKKAPKDICEMLDERAHYILEQEHGDFMEKESGIPFFKSAFPSKKNIAEDLIKYTISVDWMRNFCSIVNDCRCTLYVLPNDGRFDDSVENNLNN